MKSLVFLCALGVLLSGCAGRAPASSSDEPAPDVITDPNDLSYLQNATPGSHAHDYWGGRTEVDVLDLETGGGTIQYAGDHGVMASFQPPEGNIVPQGTGELEAMLDWTISERSGPLPDPLPTKFTRIEVWVKTAIDGESRFVAVAEKGVPFRFNSTNEQDDPPHYTISLWEFDVVVWNEGGEDTTFSGTFHLVAKAFRTLPLVVFPPHPDQWNGASEIELAQFDMAVMLHTGLVVTYGCFGGCADTTFVPGDGLVVPYDTLEVLVTVTTDTASTPVPFLLQAHGSESRTLTDIPATRDEVGEQFFRIPVLQGDLYGDSPYASQSLWQFRVHMSTPMDQGAWTGTYHVTAVATK